MEKQLHLCRKILIICSLNPSGSEISFSSWLLNRARRLTSGESNAGAQARAKEQKKKELSFPKILYS